jgi:pimeloyl-ACP methyl ester carboxylesterase
MWLLWLALGICAALLLTAGLLMRVYLGAYRSYDVMGFADHLSGAMAPYAPVIRAAIEATATCLPSCGPSARTTGCGWPATFTAPRARPGGTVLLVHGFRGGSRGDFSCAIPLYHRLGWNELLIDQRAQGRSEGARMGLGVLERRDVAAWARELSARLPGLPIVLDGISMGASSVMMACGLPLPAEVRGVIADCGFTSPEGIFRWLLERGHAPAALLLPLFRLAAPARARLRPARRRHHRRSGAQHAADPARPRRGRPLCALRDEPRELRSRRRARQDADYRPRRHARHELSGR